MGAISSMDMPGIDGKPGISIPRIGGIPMPREGIPIPPKTADIMLVLELELEEEEKDEDCIDEPMFMPPMFMPPMFMLPIILLMGGMPPIMGMFPPDIMVDEEEDELLDLKLEMVEPSGDWVVAAMLWLLAFSSFFTAVPSSVTKACDCAFIASLT